MAGRFNIRPRYGANEPTTGDYLHQGISGALDSYLQEREARRQEENQIRAQGGVAVGTPETASDRIGAIKRRVGSIFGRGGPSPSAPASQTSPYNDPATPTPPATQQPPTMPAPVAAGARRFPPPVSSSIPGSPGYADQSQFPRPPIGGPGTTPPIMPPRAQSSISSAIGSQLDPTDTSYQQTARSGQRYRIDPMRGAKAEIALKDRQRDTDEQREIAALVSTGQWTPAQAAARVRGKLAYGEEFGRTRQANQLTFEQRQQLLERTISGNREVARIRAAGTQNTAEGRQIIQQQILDLREAALAMQAAGLEATGYENQAKALEATIPKGVDAVVAGSQPGGKEKIAANEAAAAAARARGQDVRRVAAGSARSLLTSQKPKVTQAQYDSGRAKGHSDADIAKSYDVTGIVRKP